MVRIVLGVAIGLETYVVTLNAWPNVDILMSFEKCVPAWKIHLPTKTNFVLTGVNISFLLFMAEFGRSLANLHFVFVFIMILQYLLKADAFSP